MIRAATGADRDAVRALHLASWQANYRGTLPDDYLRDALPAEVAAKWAARSFEWPEVTLLEEGPDGPAGFVCALADRAVPLVDNLHTRPGLYGRGTGARLLRAVRAALAERGFERCTLTVLESNAAGLRFYLREGGRDEGPEEDMLVGHPVRVRRIGFGAP